MGYRPQTGSRRSAGQKYQKSKHEKAKAKEHKQKSGSKYLQEEHVATSDEIVERTLSRLSKLGNQVFALSPFSQYFDDWLLNLKEVIAEFESNPAISTDEEFAKTHSQIISNVERELAAIRGEEKALEEATKNLSENNHLLVQIDAEYAKATRELGFRRNSEIQGLIRNVHDVEEELDRIGRMKTSLLRFTKKAKAQREAEATQKLNSAKSELESAVKNFTVEQEKLHDEYEKRKQGLIEQVRSLEKEVEKLEKDGSLEVRRVACDDLVNAVKAFLQRKTVSTI
jgi:hypothetical protein